MKSQISGARVAALTLAVRTGIALADAMVIVSLGRRRVSKHQNTWEKGFNGKVKLNRDSGLRKLMRAARRDKLDSYTKLSIKLAMKSATLS